MAGTGCSEMDLRHVSSNWKKLQASGKLTNSEDSSIRNDADTAKRGRLQNGTLKRKKTENSLSKHHRAGTPVMKKRKSLMEKDVSQASNNLGSVDGLEDSALGKPAAQLPPGDRVNEGLAIGVDVGKYIALDCEMVGVGPHPDLESALARVSVVNYNGEQVYDSFVKPREEVTDWRTHVSGIRKEHMTHARSLEVVQADVATLLRGRIVVGHAVRRDFEVLLLDHPKQDIRDTARHPPYRKFAGGGSPKLKILVSELLGLEIQTGEHSSIEDARATMLLFRRDKNAFETEHIKRWGIPAAVKKADEDTSTQRGPRKSRKKKKKR